jgi:hypothetical protein
MKKRWGKPITQVQRFVPQEYAAQCTSYSFVATGFTNKIYIDYINKGKRDPIENQWNGYYNGRTVTSTTNKPVTEVNPSEYDWYERISNNTTNDYTDKRYYNVYTYNGPSVIYYYDSHFYAGQKNQS